MSFIFYLRAIYMRKSNNIVVFVLKKVINFELIERVLISSWRRLLISISNSNSLIVISCLSKNLTSGCETNFYFFVVT